MNGTELTYAYLYQMKEPPVEPSEDSSVEDIENFWEKKGKELSKEGRDPFGRYLRAISGSMLEKIAFMRVMGFSEVDIRKEQLYSASLLNQLAGQFFADRKSYEIDKTQSRDRFNAIGGKIEDLGKEIATDTASYLAERKYGKGMGVAVRFSSNLLGIEKPPEGVHPVVDRIVAAAVETGVHEAIVLYGPRLVRGPAVPIAGAVGEWQVGVSRRQIDYIEARQKDPDVGAFEGFCLNVQKGKMYKSAAMGYVLQAPAVAIDFVVKTTVHHAVADVKVAYGCMRSLYQYVQQSEWAQGSQEKMAEIARRAISFLAENNPEVLGEKMWEKVAEDKKK